MASQSPISPDLLKILRDPKAIQDGVKYGPDPGRLTLVRDTWLVSADTGYKYPIRNGIPVMLVEEGARWKDTPVDSLPVPPPAEVAPPVVEGTRSTETGGSLAAANDTQAIIAAAAGALTLIVVAFLVWRLLFGRRS